MVDIISFLEEGEDAEFEVKKAQGFDGRGTIPRDMWKTYSAFANSHGGYILLGVEEMERGGPWNFVNLTDCKKFRLDIATAINNPETVSANLVSEEDLRIISHEGREAILIYVRKADRNERPVFIGNNPLTGTYRRNDSGDYLVNEAVVRRMLAEASEEPRDGRLLARPQPNDLNAQTIKRYRAALRACRPNHAALAKKGVDFLQAINAVEEDPASGELRVTAAGLLMFGNLVDINREFPQYRVDYQEKDDPDATHHSYRIAADGTWSGNLFDFYLKVRTRLRSSKYSLDDEQLKQALEEALVNSLIHSDYGGSTPVYIASCPKVFRFRNPGGLRVPLRKILAGTLSDCRNKTLQRLFFFSGAAEQAGTGIPRIFSAWKKHQWRPPLLREELEPEMTILELRTIDILPAAAVAALGERFGETFTKLRGLDRLAVVTAYVENRVTNERLQQFSDEEPRLISARMKKLVAAGLLVQTGTGRGTSYLIKPTATVAE